MPENAVRGRIAPELQAEAGRALCIWGDPGFGSLVHQGKYRDRSFAQELVEACVTVLRDWDPDPAPAWVTCVPSKRHPTLVPKFAERLAAGLGLPFCPAFEQIDDRPEQKTMANSTQQALNVDGSLQIGMNSLPLPDGPVLLVDDIVDSRWTMTVAAWLLRSFGSGEVWPLGLAYTGQDE